MRKLRNILLFNLALLVAVELGLRAAVGLGWLILPAGGLAGFDAMSPGAPNSVEMRLYRPDRHLIRRMQANFHRVYPARALFPGRDDSYEVTTNERGFRTAPFRSAKSPGTFRIICMGDSSTFGFQVDDADAYPRLVARLLEEAHPGKFEVLNLGAPGYTTRQGIELLRREALGFEPDLVTFAYGTNDRFFSGPMSDDELIRLNQSPTGTVLFHLREGLDRTYIYRMFKLMLARFVSRPTEKRAGGGKRRVSLEEMRATIAEAKRLLADRGASLVLINNDFAVTDAVQALETAAQETGVDLLDMHALLDGARRERSRGFEEKLGLHPSEPPPGKFLLRVLATQKRQVVVRVAIFGRPRVEIEMRDDGSEGDQRPGDAVWSAWVDGRAGHKITYTYWERTEGGLVKEYRDNALTPLARAEVVPASRIADIDVFGDYYLKSDGSHPDEEGHRLIAERLYDHIVARAEVQAFLAGAGRAETGS
jgi:lysophospholipase L1-like esterase